MDEDEFWANRWHRSLEHMVDEISPEKLYLAIKARFEREDQSGQRLAELEHELQVLKEKTLALEIQMEALTRDAAPKTAPETA
jgi:hypothetical protein